VCKHSLLVCEVRDNEVVLDGFFFHEVVTKCRAWMVDGYQKKRWLMDD
jgi:hypothetical protein